MKEKQKIKKKFTIDIDESGPMFHTMHKGMPNILKMKSGKHSGNCCSFGFDTSSGTKHYDMSFNSNVHQEIDDGTLFLYLELPGIDKSSLKIRAKPNKVSIEANRKDLPLYKDDKVNIKLSLEEEIIPDTAKASYSDGILKISFPVANPGYEVTEID